MISIHVPREGDDCRLKLSTLRPHTISIHVPREGDDLGRLVFCYDNGKFQSTSPVRGTTTDGHLIAVVTPISIHVPREGDDSVQAWLLQAARISIHVPREGDDPPGPWPR